MNGTRIRIIEDTTPSPDLCTCAAGRTVRLSIVHHIDCAYSKARLNESMGESMRAALDADARKLQPPVRQIACYTRVASAAQLDTADRSLTTQDRALLHAIHCYYRLLSL